jgi:CheY-like chemotaxis protein
MLEKINSAASHLLQLIDDVLDMSDIEDKKFHLVCAEFSFTVAIQEILNRVNPYIKEKQQSLTTDIDPSIPDIIISDEKRLTQVILNLLSNAGKFTPEQGTIQINAFVLETENETLTMQIEIIDNGIGISKEQQENLFVPFEQADGGIDRKFGGAGLGLPISKHIIELMNGEIWIESEPGKGSKFAFTMKAQLKATETQDDGPVSFEGKTALLVEDVEINREIVIALLEDTELQRECAENGREALELYTAAPERFDVILMDINMPEMDGVEATRQIRALETSNERQIPIIAMTANVLTSEVETYFAVGMNDHVGKPIDFDKLMNTLMKYLK